MVGQVYSVPDRKATQVDCRTVKPNNLLTESVNLGFETSIDCSDGKNEDADILFQQLDTERKVYWAEPIQVPEGFGTLEDSDGFQFPKDSPASPVSSSTVESMSLPVSSAPMIKTDQTPRHSSIDESSSLTFTELLSLSATSQLKPTSHSVSVQIASFQSSHIVCRKDVPFWTESKHTQLQSNLKLETYTSFCTVQKWADLQIQRNALINKLTHEGLCTIPNHQALSSSHVTHPPSVIFPSFPYFPLLSKDWKSHKSVTVMAGKYEAAPVCVDTGLWSREQDEGLGRKNNKLLKNHQTPTVQRYRSCDHKGNLSAQKCYVNHHQTNPYSRDELEEMKLCLQQFNTLFSNMEQKFSEERAAAYSALSDADRENVQDIEMLRSAVKLEAEELEMQLNELAHQYDEM
ncbi:uncharacterized protein LOC106528572 [Austrofundulus limnaeus]|uniref:Uncharacterized protein LOC106528572 n=1 Tax=Austrofundulus limnaeus TaxID=52670 RepID=A0A2I4CGX9_AUSLI|nr:PREDICTED: uncharacterized protein LOC106528572 [Austrofundulus limnaeus]XP_013879233.1 PREDICTED: uncharacterized protein LOC106528572 [Austrofundulus limnaeus]